MLILLVRQKTNTTSTSLGSEKKLINYSKPRIAYKVSLLFSQFEKIKAVTITMYDKSILFKK